MGANMARTEGARGKKTEHNRKLIVEEIQARGRRTPLEFLLRVMWNRKRPMEMRIEAAKAAAPYVHRKQPLELQHNGEVTIIPPMLPDRQQLADNKGNLED